MIDIAQLVALVLAVAVMARYTSGGARFRGGVSISAGILMATLAAWACAILVGLIRGSVWGLLLSIALLIFVHYYRGDAARMLECIKHIRARLL